MKLNYNVLFFFFFNDTAPTEIYTLSLHDALPICRPPNREGNSKANRLKPAISKAHSLKEIGDASLSERSEEHTSELQSHLNLVCRLLLEKKKEHSLARPIRKS